MNTIILAADDTWLNNPVVKGELWNATTETLLMTAWATVLAAIFGLIFGVVLTATRQDGILPNRPTNAILGFIVNVGRAIPFIILMVMMINITRMIIGQATGWRGAMIPLAISAIPYFARMVESNLTNVDRGKIEAAQMMGASRYRILTGVIVREAVPTLIQSLTILCITIIGYTAMAGAVGAGGLGALAINQGYYRTQMDVLLIIVVVIVVIVSIVQFVGDMLSRLVDHR
ncbi:MAG: methionine ABC transporter permease [Ancrocorticia sp.]|uniref:methionine ABC transporter permease n=1 Tax=Ancrocorticia sp. TaxID=2593684 RepID=UPI003F9268CE